jgi:flagellar biosynthetic protein FlhB
MNDAQAGQERTELPTPKRRESAREEGRVPKSPEVSAAVGLLAGVVTLAAAGGGMVSREIHQVLTESFGRLSSEPLTISAAEGLLRGVLLGGIRAAGPVLLAIGLPVLAIGAFQARGVWSGKPVTPDPDRINPLAGLKRMLGMQSVFTLLKALLKLVVLGAITYAALKGAWGDLAGLGGEDAGVIAAVARTLAVRLALSVGMAFLLVAAADYGFQAWQHEKQLRMTRQEVVQEHKESEGDPLLKSRMQSLARSHSRRRMLQQVREADVVVVNPVHIAVALRYEVGADGAPMVLAMGRRKLAERIKEIATESGVPIVENLPLARALIATGAVGKPIPPALYAAVAEVLAWLYRRRGAVGQRLLGAVRA